MALKPKANGYNVACRLITALTNGYPYGWKYHCYAFGPLVWDYLTENQRAFFNLLAIHYGQSDVHEAERNGQTPTMQHFVNAVFHQNLYTLESEITANILSPGAAVLLKLYSNN